jgi:ABC-type glycerol-3-phosphate transport system substrate-binding protein
MGLTTSALAASPALAACGGGQQSGPVTLKFWDTFSEAEIVLLHKMGGEYEKQNPNIKIDFFEIPFDQRETKIPTAVETDSLPDIIRADYPYQYFLSARDKLVYLEDHLEGWEMRDAIYDITWEEVTVDGHIVGIPQDKFTDVFTYNKDKFEKDGVEGFPNTWDELVTACQKMTHGDQYGIAWTAVDMFYPLLLQAGGEMLDANGRAAFNQEPGVTALQFEYDLVNEYKITPPGIAGYDYADADGALQGGTVGMAPFGSWVIGNYRVAGVDWELGIGKMPAGPAGRGAISATAPYMVMNDSDYQEEAIALIKWLVSRENALRWAKTLAHEPIDEFTAQDPYFNKPLFKPFQESLDFATTQPPTAGFNVALEELTVAQQKALTGKTTPKEALDEAAANVNEAMEG